MVRYIALVLPIFLCSFLGFFEVSFRALLWVKRPTKEERWTNLLRISLGISIGNPHGNNFHENGLVFLGLAITLLGKVSRRPITL
jgi:hypothetical protein